ncbi:potassium channel family protein [Salisediminibacterium halotolerans]|uniref:Trk system potassium uptake protein TrkA n=1 Tax=Salisediminibacterium halotolerans TaxID=517425 RepID=A0A1H9WLP5_9BACI|nr:MULTISPECIES: TrkA family potassium uptake protein [Salisediminibacterium]RLJ74374.1 trk system potassium uptake protein TrkA [Actinophytocola xinjiangensis]RPE87533.1 trk system potassium uptake protein TrkA [Salisediminibacterium halotolerans]TWG35211.1 trk system potassium uptake protein TrkA [Salisediminibacterium halotolerans]SES34820.1 trk system potassium uptake protein TrkA [Salisediminibacterium haloalkalitolerans]GEL08157.1 ktr system potassium uptake protein A [Salisediminibacter
MKKQFAIIGLGRFGSSVCRELHHMGHEVLAIDKNEKKVDALSDVATHTLVADVTDETALQRIGIRNFEHVIVGIGEDIQASILATLHLKDFDVPKVWVKAQNNYHHKVLEKIGADRIFHPEHDMGYRIAEFLTSEKVLDYIDLSSDYSIVEMLATDKINNKSLVELDIRAKYGCTVIAIKKTNKVDVTPNPTEKINKGDILVMIGNKKDLRRFQDGAL